MTDDELWDMIVVVLRDFDWVDYGGLDNFPVGEWNGDTFWPSDVVKHLASTIVGACRGEV